MTVLDAPATPKTILDFVDEQVRALQSDGAEPRTILVGPDAFEALQDAVAARFGRERARVEQYQWLSVVVDPFRGDRVCVVPTSRDLADGVRAERIS